MLRPAEAVLRRMLVLSRCVMRGFAETEGLGPSPGHATAFLRRHGLLDEVDPSERALLFDPPNQLDRKQIVDGTWRAEAMAALLWATGFRKSLPLEGQVSLLQAVPAPFGDDKKARALLDAPPPLRPEEEIRRAMEIWWVVHWRLVAFERGTDSFDLSGWVKRSPWLTISPSDLPLIDGDLSLDATVMSIAASHLSVDPFDPPQTNGRIRLADCTVAMLTAGENMGRVVIERLRALQWLCGVVARMGQEPLGRYRPLSPAACDKSALYGEDAAPAPTAPDQYDASGGLLLQRAAWRGDAAAIRSILASEGDLLLMTPDIDGDLPLHCAVLGGHPDAVAAILEASPSGWRFRADEDHRTALHVAASLGAIDAIERIAHAAIASPAPDLGPEPLSPLDRLGRTPLTVALTSNHVEAVKRLIALGACPDGVVAANGQRSRPVTLAAELNRPEMIRCLAAAGAQIDEVDEAGTTPLYRAIFHNQREAAFALLSLGANPRYTHPSGQTNLHSAANVGATDLCQALVEAGVAIDARLEGFGAVHFAFLGGHAECARWLLAKGADPSIERDGGLLGLAIEGGSAQLIEEALGRGQTVSQAPGGLAHCAVRGTADALRVLLRAGAPVNGIRDDRVTPLHLAADRGHAACVEALIEAGADVSIVEAANGYTALHLAAMSGHDECVRLLLAAGAKPNAKDKEGRTPLVWAKRFEYLACVEMLGSTSEPAPAAKAPKAAKPPRKGPSKAKKGRE